MSAPSDGALGNHPSSPLSASLLCGHGGMSTHVGPRASQVRSQLWGPMVLKQWSAAVATVHADGTYGAGGMYDLGTDFIQQVLLESQRVWLAHATAQDGLIKARTGPGGTMAWVLRELQLHPQAEWQGVPQAALN